MEYGNVAAGMTTDYRDVPGGVYQYAAYRLIVNGEDISQPVIDWVGERPMDGARFTYTVNIDSTRRPEVVQLVRVTRDE